MFAGVFNKWRSGCKKIKPISVKPIETTIPMTKELATDFFNSFSSLEPKLLAVTIARPFPIPKAKPTSKS